MTAVVPDPQVALAVSNLTVTYGSSRGIVDVSMEVPARGVTGLLGSNGAGKTTLLRAALDLVHPSSGSVRVGGIDSRVPAARAEVTYLPGDLVLPSRLTGWAVLRRFTAARGAIDVDRVRTIAERLDLDLDRPVGQLSRGNRQKVGLVLAFAPASRLLLLDEPTSGLDPLLQREFGDLVRETVAGGSAVLLSSHVLSELEELADRVAVLREGRLVAFESIETLREGAERGVAIRFSTEEEAQEFAARLPQAAIRLIEVSRDRVRLSFAGDVDPIIKAASAFHTREIESLGGDLDDVLLRFYEAGDAT